MTDEPDPINLAQELLDSLYASGDLSVDQHAGITRGLTRARALDAYSDRLEQDRDVSVERFRGLLAELDAAKAERDEYKHANTLAAQAYVQQEGRAQELESQLGQAHEQLHALQDELTRLQSDVAAAHATRDQAIKAADAANTAYAQLLVEMEAARAVVETVKAIRAREVSGSALLVALAEYDEAMKGETSGE